MVGELAKALARGTPAARVQSDHKIDVMYQNDYPFPCLLNPEEDPAESVAEEDGSDAEDTAGDDELIDELDEFVTDLSSLRVSSHVKHVAIGPQGQQLVDYEIHPQHRRDAKEALPSSLPSSYRSNFITPAVLGSLPGGLTQTEKAGVMYSASPAAVKFESLPVGRASSRSAEGSAFRRGVLRGAVVAFITAGYSGKRFVFEKAKELGIRTVILDGPDSWSQVLVKEGLAEKFIPLDFAEADTVLDRVLKALNSIRDTLGLDAVTTFNEFAVQLVARLAERLGLPGNPPSACDMARDKSATRRIMEAANLPSPKHAMIHSLADCETAAAAVGFPAVIKPITAAASMGVVRVDSLEELKQKVEATQKQIASLYLDDTGHIVQAEDHNQVDQAKKDEIKQFVSSTLMMEEYLDGDEVDCDLVMSNGECTYGAVTDNWPTIEPYFNETGSNCPSILPIKTQKELLDLAVASVKVLGFQLGVFHVELKATSRGPRLIEVNARMGGGGVRDINRVVWGVDLVEEHLLASCGLPAKPLIARKPLVRLAEYSINAPVTGIIERDDFLTPWESLPEIIYARPLVAAGDKVISVTDGMPSWVCEVCVHKPTVREAIQFVKQIEKDIVFPIRPGK